MERIVNEKGIHTLWDSVEEFDKDGKKLIDKHNHAVLSSVFGNHTYYKATHWYNGCHDHLEVFKHCREGWTEMLQKLEAMWGDERPELELAASTAKVRRRKRSRADQGDTLDMHRVWNGELDRAWERPERVYKLSTSQRHATIYIDISTRAMDSADATLWRAAAAMLICDLLIASGRSVQIYVGICGTSAYAEHMGWFWTGICVKRFDEPLQPERLCAMVTAAAFRTYGFSMICAQPLKALSYMSHPRNEGLPVQIQQRVDDGELVARIGFCTSMTEAEAEFLAVKAQLQKQEVENKVDFLTQGMEDFYERVV